MTEILETAEPVGRIAPSARLRQKIEAVRRKHVAVRAASGFALWLTAAVLMLMAGMFLDWWLELPRLARTFLLLIEAAVQAFIMFQFTIHPCRHRPDDDSVALMLEHARPEFRGRLISAIQLVRRETLAVGTSPVLIEALIEETEAMAAQVDFTEVIKTKRLLRLAGAAISVLAVGIALHFHHGQTSRDLLKRAFLSNIPVPRKTRVLDVTGHRTIGRGDHLTLAARVEGVIPSTGRVTLKYASGREQNFSLEPVKTNRSRFRRQLENVTESFTYSIRLNDGVSQPYQIKVLPPPSVSSVEGQQIFPAYTRLAPVRRSMGDLSLLAGSQLQLKAIASKNIQRAEMRLVGLDQNLPMHIQAPNRRELTNEITIPAKGLGGFSIQLLDEDGVESKDAAVYRIEIVTDRAPVVKVLYPERKEELITQQAMVLIAFEAIDDFAIGRVVLHHKVDVLDSGAEKATELDLGGETLKSFRRRFEWKLAEFRPLLPEGATIEYWVEVHDTNDATGPGIGASEHFLAKVVSESEKRADLLNRVGDALSSIGDVARDQEKLNQTLGTLILEKPGAR